MSKGQKSLRLVASLKKEKKKRWRKHLRTILIAKPPEIMSKRPNKEIPNQAHQYVSQFTSGSKGALVFARFDFGIIFSCYNIVYNQFDIKFVNFHNLGQNVYRDLNRGIYKHVCHSGIMKKKGQIIQKNYAIFE